MSQNVNLTLSCVAKLGVATQKHEPVGTVTLFCKYLTGKRPVWFCLEEHFMFLFIGKCLDSSSSEQIHPIGDKQYYHHILRPVQSETFWRVIFRSSHLSVASRLPPASVRVSSCLHPFFLGA